MSDAPEVKLILNDEQQHYVEMLKEGVSACPEGLSVSIIVETTDGFFLLGSCCPNCTHVMIHNAAAHCEDPRDNLTMDVPEGIATVQ